DHPAFRKFLSSDDPAAADALLAAARDYRTVRCDVLFLTGLRRLAAGQREEAFESFASAAATRAFVNSSWEMSLAFLARRQRDRDWPRWSPGEEVIADKPLVPPTSSLPRRRGKELRSTS